MSARKGFENTEQGRRKSFVFLTYLNIERSLRIQIETEKGRTIFCKNMRLVVYWKTYEQSKKGGKKEASKEEREESLIALPLGFWSEEALMKVVPVVRFLAGGGFFMLVK